MGFLDLFRPAYRHSDEDKRRAAIVEIRDKNLLAKIFRSDPSLDNRLLALVELSGTNDHDFFEPLIESLTQEELAYFLVQKIEEPFHNSSSDWILYALEKETIEKVLTKYRLIGYHTAKTLINQNGKSEAILAILATKVNNDRLLWDAIYNINDESLLKQVVLGVHPSVAGHLSLALEKIRSKELLVEIVMKCSHYPAGLWECLQERGVLSRELLLDIARNAVNESCRAFALESLDDWGAIIDLLKQGNELGDQMHTGMRLREILDLEWHYVDLFCINSR